MTVASTEYSQMLVLKVFGRSIALTLDITINVIAAALVLLHFLHTRATLLDPDLLTGTATGTGTGGALTGSQSGVKC